MLKQIGIRSKDTIEAFSIGYSDGKLASRVNGEQIRDLRRIGLLTANNRETFRGFLTFPILDSVTGNIIDIHGINPIAKRKRNLFDPQRGLMGHGVLNASKEIVIVDRLALALRIHQAGYHAVIHLWSIKDFKSNLEAFKAARLKKVWIATRKNTSGIIERLKPLGPEILRLDLPKDSMAIRPSTIQDLLASAETIQPMRPRLDFLEYLADGGMFRQDGCLYKVVGIKADKSGSGQKVVLTVTRGASVHADRIDLYSASSRSRFAKTASGLLAADKNIIETSLLGLLDELDLLRAEIRRKQSSLPVEANQADDRTLLPEEQRKQTLANLEDPNLLDNISDDLLRLGLVGERDNAMLLFLVAVSRKLTRPLSAILCSESASGKSNLVDSIIRLLPDEDVIYVSRLSATALFYMPEDSLKHRLLVVEERDGSDQADYAVRVLQSKGQLTTAVPMPQEEPGVLRTKLITVKGPVAYVETTTNQNIDPQNLNRCFSVKMDESSEQTDRILKDRQQRRCNYSGHVTRGAILDRHHDMQRMLYSVTVAIPYGSHLRFPSHQVRFRRDHERLLGLIDASCLLHQHQRETIEGANGQRIVLATIDDYAIAYRLCSRAMDLAVDELSPNARAAWEGIIGFKGKPFTRRGLMEKMKWSYWRTYSALAELRRHDLLGHDPGKSRSPATYMARSSVPVRPEIDLITPENLKRSLSVAVGRGAKS